MDAENWERCLTEHYLRSDGPYGGAPITFIDATPAELAATYGRPELADEATKSFLQQFDAADVKRWLDGYSRPPAIDREVPGYFRYLVLTCYVTATHDGVGDTNNFRIRLGEILRSSSDFNAVSGVNRLWQELATWCDRCRSRGAPIRRLILPDPGNMSLIGHAVRIAFPAWRDRASFARLFRHLPSDIRRQPQRLIDELMRPHCWAELPEAIRNACSDFTDRMRSGQRLLSGHRFWVLVESIDATLLDARSVTERPEWRLDAHFGGFESDVVEFRLLVDGRTSKRGYSDPEPLFAGSLRELLVASPEIVPKLLSDALHCGVLIFGERSGGCWTYDEAGLSDDEFAIVVARSNSVAKRLSLQTSWTRIEPDWFVSDRLRAVPLRELRRATGQTRDPATKMVDVRVVGGVHTAPRVLLGRPAFLPSIVASDTSTVGFEALGGASGTLNFSGHAPEWRLESTGPLNGRWRVTVTEGQTDVETTLTFEANAPERYDLGTQVGDVAFAVEEELSTYGCDVGPLVTVRPEREWAGGSPITDLMEAIYAGAGTGWIEADLVPLVQALLPSKHMVWDVLRAFAEASWIEPRISQAWRARKWRLCEPTVSDIGAGYSLVEGALATSALNRLTDLLNSNRGRVLLLGGLSDLCPPLVLVAEFDSAALSNLTGWPQRNLKRPIVKSAPACWPIEKRTCDGRFLAGVWSFDRGLFLPPTSPKQDDEPSIERWVRERGDDRDVFRISWRGGDFITSSRTVAIIEGHRRRQTPLFQWNSGRFTRFAKAGYLPLPVAKALRRSSLMCSGPSSIADGHWSYFYAASATHACWVRELFGAAIVGPPTAPRVDRLGDFVRARRSGARPVWRADNTVPSVSLRTLRDEA